MGSGLPVPYLQFRSPHVRFNVINVILFASTKKKTTKMEAAEGCQGF